MGGRGVQELALPAVSAGRAAHPGRGVKLCQQPERTVASHPLEQSPSPALHLSGHGHRKAIPVGRLSGQLSKAGWAPSTCPKAAWCPCRSSVRLIQAPELPAVCAPTQGSPCREQWPAGTARHRSVAWGRGVGSPSLSPANHPSALKCGDVPLPGPEAPTPQWRDFSPQSPGLQATTVPSGHQSLPRVNHTCPYGRIWAVDAPCRLRTHPRSTPQLASVSGALTQTSLIRVRDAGEREKGRVCPSSLLHLPTRQLLSRPRT